MTEGPDRKEAKSTVFIENDRTRVTEWRFAPGAHTGWHRHEYDYVIVPLLDGNLDIDTGNGEISTAELKLGVPYFRETGVEHDVINANAFEYAFLEVEFLR